MFHPSDELPIKTSVYYSLYKMCQCVFIISVRREDIMQKFHLKETVVFKPSGVMEPVVPLPGTEWCWAFPVMSDFVWHCQRSGQFRLCLLIVSWNSNSPELFLSNVLSSFSTPAHVRMETKGAVADVAVPERGDLGRGRQGVWVTYGLSCHLCLPQAHSGTMAAWPGFSRWDISLF